MKTCCLIITYNRKELLCRCVEKCLTQSAQPDLLIFDNVSTDGTRELLEKKGYLFNKRIHYFLSDKNGGGSYGFSNGLKECLKLGYDYAWMMDDDGYPENEDCLQKCIDYAMIHKDTIINPLVHDGDYLSFKQFNCYRVEDFLNKVDHKDYVIGTFAPYNGTLVSKEIIEKVCGCN